MTNEKTQPFDAEQWLATQKKGFGGKVSREVFITKLKELGTEIEQLKKNQTAWETKNKNLEEKLATVQSDIQEKENTVAQTWTDLDKQVTDLKQKITEQEKLLKSKENELSELNRRPNITKEQHQELVNNQEKHSETDLKPDNLPTDWETKLESIKDLETRPTTEELQQAIQQETEKYKDYKKLDATEQEAINNYSAVKTELTNWTNTFFNKKPEQIKAEIDKPRGTILSSEEQKKLDTYESLKTELEQLKKDYQKYKLEKTEKKETETNNSELITRIKNLEQLITPLQLEIKELKKNPGQIPLELPTDYNSLKKENEGLWRIVNGLNPYES